MALARILGLSPAAVRVLPHSQPQVPADTDLPGDLGQGLLIVDDTRPEQDEFPLRVIPVFTEDEIGHHHLEHRVPEELEALVGRSVPVLRNPGTVAESLIEELGIGEGIAERILQAFPVVAVGAVHERTSPCSSLSTKPPLTPSTASRMALKMAKRDDEPWQITTPADVPTRWAPP